MDVSLWLNRHREEQPVEASGSARSFELQNKQERNRFLQRNRLCVVGANNRCQVLDPSGRAIGSSRRQPDGSFQIEIEGRFISLLDEQDQQIPATEAALGLVQSG